jgi:phytoene desaturase
LKKGYVELADVPFNKPFTMIKQLPSLLALKSYKSVYSLVASYIKNEKLRRMLSMHPLLVGGNPFTTTSIYGLILYLEKKMGNPLFHRWYRKYCKRIRETNE